jgi:hypothetical protein
MDDANERASGRSAWREYTLLDFGIAQVRHKRRAAGERPDGA